MSGGASGLRLDLVPSISDGHKGRENAIVPAHFLFRHEHVRWPACLANCHEALSYLWSWGWPEEKGEITAADVERPKNRNGNLHLAVAYKFSVNGDGSYTGESFWTPALATKGGFLQRGTRFAWAIPSTSATRRMIPASTGLIEMHGRAVTNGRTCGSRALNTNFGNSGAIARLPWYSYPLLFPISR